MEALFETQNVLLKTVSHDFERSLQHELPWDERAMMLFGARGSGKTTLFLQHLKNNYTAREGLYVTLDDIYFRQHTLVETARTFAQNNGKIMLLDEVHKYDEWSREVKNIIDLIPDLKLLITGSSILELQRSGADLSRRVLNYQLTELSFREYLGIRHKMNLPRFSLTEILENHQDIANELMKTVEKPLFHFKEYLNKGAYPIFKETKEVHQRLKQTINLIIDVDLPNSISVEFKTLHQVKKLLYIIAQSVPFTPNITKLAEQVGCTRTRLYDMLRMLEAARLTYGLYGASSAIGMLSKPEKIYLHNSNLLVALSEEKPNVGTIRETFFINIMDSAKHKVNFTKSGDFMIDEKWIFEVGGRNKTQKQIQNQSNAYLVKDDIEFGYMNSIPIWVFGFLF